MKERLEKIIFETTKNILNKEKLTISLDQSQVKLENISKDIFGDFSTNIFMILKLNQETVDKIINQLQDNVEVKTGIEKIEFKQPGFLNFYVKTEFLLNNLKTIVDLNKRQFFTANRKSFLIEHASPNTNKALHIGHLRNTVLAMAIIRILKALNHKVTSDCLFNDRGVHICKAMLGYLRFNDQVTDIKELLNQWLKQPTKWPQPLLNEPRDAFVGKYYI
ncbi:MAG: arginine--tRNA ligase [Candidatus Paceibacterota bacterium]|jgi:arginyl-tRNA synthetase